MPKPPKLLCCTERGRQSPNDTVHPGWIRATSILLRGMERLRAQEQALSGEPSAQELPL